MFSRRHIMYLRVQVTRLSLRNVNSGCFTFQLPTAHAYRSFRLRTTKGRLLQSDLRFLSVSVSDNRRDGQRVYYMPTRILQPGRRRILQPGRRRTGAFQLEIERSTDLQFIFHAQKL